MRPPVSRVLAVLASLGAVVAAPCAQVRADDFQISFAAGSPDAAAGGTEMRLLTAHAGRLYAGNGYWEDRPGRKGCRAQVCPRRAGHAVAGRSRVEERLPSGQWRDLAVGALAEADFATDGSGAPLPRPVSRCLPRPDLTGAARVFARCDRARGSRYPRAGSASAPDFLPQIRASLRVATGRRADLVLPEGTAAFRRQLRSGGAWSGPMEPRRNSTHRLSRPRFQPCRPAAGQRFCRGQRPPHHRSRPTDHERIDGRAPQWRLVTPTRGPAIPRRAQG
jgi:hypothetical protein